MRGWFAEFLVAAALGTHHGVRQSWDTVDVKTKAGKTIQVKCSAYLQSWAQERLSPVRFSVKAACAWDPDTGTMKDRGRHADVYVFVHQKHTDKATLNPLDLTQFDFYVVPTVPWCITLDNSKGISRLRFWAKNRRVNGINDLPVFMHQGTAGLTSDPWGWRMNK